MSQNEARNLVTVISSGPLTEKASIGFTISNGGLTAGLKVSIFLTGDGVDIVRKNAVDLVQAHPLEPLKGLVGDFIKRGGVVWACTPCAKARGYEKEDLIDGVVIAGANGMHELIQAGAATLSF
jgi:predicted peroxiredoxin